MVVFAYGGLSGIAEVDVGEDTAGLREDVGDTPAPTVGTVVVAPVPIGVAAPSVMVYVLPSLCSSSVHSVFRQQTS